ncbi:MAG: YihA family ribosome biogenesis GTP-binding protein [Burkholderiales bacterium]|nr:YihA family ribosome biogenesis GTP-binding protein [Burkholderiales bacterium]
MTLFSQAAFFTTVNHYRDLPREVAAEVAFAGRSNAGKSSAINTLAGRTRLAFVSKTPGRTQHINYFSLGNDNFLVDLPGYGYAKVPDEIRMHWENLLSRYLREREQLKGLILIMDSRHSFTPLDIRMLDWFCPTGKPVHILLTKSDKLSRQQALKTLHDAEHLLKKSYPNYTVQLFSSLKKIGIGEVEQAVAGWFA